MFGANPNPAQPSAGAESDANAEYDPRIPPFLKTIWGMFKDKFPDAAAQLKRVFMSIKLSYRHYLDEAVPHVTARWIGTLALALVYCIRVFILSGHYIVTYALGIYFLGLLIGFLSPKDDVEDDDSALPTHKDDEFRPFIRRLPEYKFWFRGTRALLIGLFCTFLGFLDIPVFWPILLIYFIVLFFSSMKKQVEHMIKHHYIPFNLGKKIYRGGEGTEALRQDTRSTKLAAASEVFQLGGSAGGLSQTGSGPAGGAGIGGAGGAMDGGSSGSGSALHPTHAAIAKAKGHAQ